MNASLMEPDRRLHVRLRAARRALPTASSAPGLTGAPANRYCDLNHTLANKNLITLNILEIFSKATAVYPFNLKNIFTPGH
jgi:hypothetical protein